jgi:hypothetical protein
MGVAMEGTNKASVVHLTSLLSKWTVVKGGLETTTDIISHGQIITEDIQHLSDDHKRVF